MAAELPDIDDPVSYVIDDGEAIGPITLADIVRSIAAGERSTDCYVWWRGATQWMSFSANPRLIALLDDVTPPEVAQALDTVSEAEPDEEELPPVIIELAPEDSANRTAEMAIEGEEIIDLAEPAPVSAAGDISNATPVEEPVRVIDMTDAIDMTDTIDLTNSAIQLEEVSLDQISISDNSVLADVGARLEALASTTRYLQESTKLDRAGASPIEPAAHAGGPAHADEDIDLRSIDSSDDDEELPPVIIELPEDSSEVRASTNEARFDRMVRQTAHHERLLEQSERVRELLARTCGAAISRRGFSVDRRNELRGHYFLGFESGVDTRRIRLEISPAASVSGDSEQSVHVVMSWGRMAFDITEALRIVQAQLPVGDRRPGMISSDAELDTGSVSTRVELVWNVDEYVGNDYSIDREKLEGALDAALHALEQRWYELFIPAE